MIRMAVVNAFACTPRRFVLAVAVAACIAIPAHAGITQIVIDTKVSPAFGGASFGAIGQYEILTGRAFVRSIPTMRSTRS
jgi:hypothetical protein